MRLRSWFVAVLVAAVAAVPALAETKLEWKLKEGDKFFAEIESKTKQKMNVLGMEINEDMDQITVVSYKVAKKTDDGLVLEQKIESLKIDGGGQAVAFLGDTFKKMEGITCNVVLDKNYQVTRVENVDEAVKKLSEGLQVPLPPQVVGQLVTGQLQGLVAQVFGFKLPDKAVSKGDKWESKTTAAPQGLMVGNATQQDNYVFEGEEGGKARIAVESTLEFKGDKLQQGPVNISKLEFKSEKSKGTILFDAQGGRLVERNGAMKFKMSGIVNAMGNELPVEMDFDVQGKAKVMDKAP